MTDHIFASVADSAVCVVLISKERGTITFVFPDGTKGETPIASSIEETIASFDASKDWVRTQ